MSIMKYTTFTTAFHFN